MKKCFLIGVAACAALMITGCRGSESAYKAAYERAQQNQQTEVTTPVVAPVETPVTTVTPVTPVTPVVAPTDPSTVTVRTESVTLVNGTGLQAYNVICGSFSIQSNAENLQNTLKAAGYPAQIVVNTSITPNMYRVVATTHADKASAVQSRDVLRAKYPDAWLLYNQ